jgi:beta-galactosidase
MKKLLPTALLLFCMHSTLYARPELLADTLGPIVTTLVPTRPAPSPGVSPVTIRVFNNSSHSLAGMTLVWELLANGIVRQKGSIPQLSIAPQHSALFRLPAKIPPTNEELFLHVQYKLRKATPSHTESRLVTEDQLLLKAWNANDLGVRPSGELSFTDEDGFFTISSPAILLRFNKQTGWLQHYEVKGLRLLEDTLGLKPFFWADPAPGDATKTGGTSASGGDTSSAPWQESTRSPRLQLFSTSTGSTIVIVRTEYTLPATSCQLHLAYTINASGEMQIEQSVDADSTQKGWPLPRFGMQWILPSGLDSITVYGPRPQGDPAVVEGPHPSPSPVGIYRQTAGSQVASSTPSRDPGPASNTGVRWWKLTGKDGKGLQITADSSLLTIGARQLSGDVLLNIDYPPSPLPYGNYHYTYKVTPVIP